MINKKLQYYKALCMVKQGKHRKKVIQKPKHRSLAAFQYLILKLKIIIH